jgi:hypothetical protein
VFICCKQHSQLSTTQICCQPSNRNSHTHTHIYIYIYIHTPTHALTYPHPTRAFTHSPIHTHTHTHTHTQNAHHRTLDAALLSIALNLYRTVARSLSVSKSTTLPELRDRLAVGARFVAALLTEFPDLDANSTECAPQVRPSAGEPLRNLLEPVSSAVEARQTCVPPLEVIVELVLLFQQCPQCMPADTSKVSELVRGERCVVYAHDPLTC